jgi:hypothetical protein
MRIGALLTPSKKQLSASMVFAYLQDNGYGYLLTDPMKMKIARWLKYQRKKEKVQALGGALVNTFGHLNQVVQTYTEAAVRARENFNWHSVYVLPGSVVHADTKKARIALSSENLLLNAYRMWAIGQPGFVCVDFTYRLIVEGHGLMCVGTVGPDQSLHIIGYGMCEREDTEAHKTIFQAIKDAVEKVVALYHTNQQRV